MTTRPKLVVHEDATPFVMASQRGETDFRKDGTLSIWTVGGRKRLTYTVPEDFKPTVGNAKEIDSLTVIRRSGQLIGRVTLTLEVPEPQGILPVGIDLNETNALVAVDPDGQTLFISGKAIKVKNRRTAKIRARLQRTLAVRKAEKNDTRSVRRLLKRLGRKQRHRTRTFAQQTAKQLVRWAPPHAVLVFEELHIPQVEKKAFRGKAIRRRLSLWQRRLIRTCVENKAQERGLLVTEVDPRYTSKNCSHCGLRGVRKRHSFTCPHCSHTQHADLNAAYNIRNRFTAFRGSALPSMSAEAQSS